jgi:hypothetical protein
MKPIVTFYFFHFISICSLLSQTTFIAYNSEWKYYDVGNKPSDINGQSWISKSYNDNAWNSGNAELGYGDGDEATTLNSSSITCYFRKDFNVTNANTITNLQLNLTYDDGAVVYLNGIQILAINMPLGPYSYTNYSSSASADNAMTSAILAFVPDEGLNVISVEVHQRDISSSDISFNLELKEFNSITPEVVRGPYLQNSNARQVKIKWRTDIPTASILRFGTDINNLEEIVRDLEDKTDHTLTVTNLLPATKYFYQIENQVELLVNKAEDLYFKTAPTAGSKVPFTAWILGDCGTSDNNQRATRDAYYNHIGASHTDMILFLGDNAYNSGTDLEYQSAIFSNMYENKLKNTVSWSTLGNHDGGAADSQTQTGPYYDIFDFPKAGECGGVASGTEAYYSFDYANAHFIVLDSYETDRSLNGTMYNWCKADIQNTTADWIIAFFHHPTYSKGSHNSDLESYSIEMRSIFLPLLESNGVDLVLNGHSHSYERSKFIYGHYDISTSFSPSHIVGSNGQLSGNPLSTDGAYEKATTGVNVNKGTAYITAGSSGKISGGTLNHPVMYTSLNTLGSCIMNINKNELSMKFLSNLGNIDDAFTIIKSYDCPQVKNINGTITTSTQYAKNEIISTGTINQDNNVIFKANNSITLDANFIASTGSIFHAVIEDCPE